MNTKRLKAEIISVFGTQGAFADAMGWHPNKVSKIMKERYCPDTEEVAKIAEELKMSETTFCSIFLR